MRLGIDLGGTKIEAAILDADARIIWRKRASTEQSSYDRLLDIIAGLVAEARQETGFSGPIGIGIPGNIHSETQLIQGASLQIINHHDLKTDCEMRLKTKVRMANDANCFALSEASDGSAAEYQTVLGVILGTGCGSGLVVGRRVIEGINGIAGEIGHNPLPWPTEDEYRGHRCWCGRDGCIETFIAGPAVADDYLARGGARLSVEEINIRAMRDPLSESDPAARVMEALEDRLARVLAMVINTFDPDAIVLGGGLSNLDRLYRHVPQKWGTYVFSKTVATQLLPPKHGDSSGVRGAAWLWDDEH